MNPLLVPDKILSAFLIALYTKSGSKGDGKMKKNQIFAQSFFLGIIWVTFLKSTSL